MQLKDMKAQPFAPDSLRGMDVGQTFECEGIFQGVTNERCVWTLVDSKSEQYVFEVTYFGVKLVEYLVIIKDEKTVEMEEV